MRPDGMGQIHKGHVLGIATLLILPIGIYAPKGIAPLFILSALAVILLEFHKNGRLAPIARPVIIVAFALPVLGILSVAWLPMQIGNRQAPGFK